MIRAFDLVLAHPGSAVPVLDGVSLAVEPGELVAVIGCNGAGKSTLVRALGGELRPRAGRVELAGRDIRRMAPTTQARARAVVPQQSHLRFALTVREVVALGRLPHVRTAAARDDRDAIEDVIARLELGALASRPVPSLSGGERQRVAVARALCQLWGASAERPAALLLDEASAALDVAHAIALLAAVRAFASARIAVLAVMHDLNLAARLADRLIVLAHGRVVADGSPRAVVRPAVLEPVYGVALHAVELPDGTPAVLPAA
jgi:iron complex transport system ATP-binding protein